MTDLFDQTDSGAIFSDCRKYRFILWRVWDKTKDYIMFIGLNPSSANEYKDDPTIKRVQKMAYNWGYGGVYMLNLYPYITPHPKNLILNNKYFDANEKWINIVNEKCKDIVFAWGSFKEAKNKSDRIISRYKGLALKINNDGSPRHPLYVNTNVELVKFN